MAHMEKLITSNEIYQGRIIRITNDTVELENGKTAHREVVHHHGGAAIIPMNQQREIYMVRQFRYPFGPRAAGDPCRKAGVRRSAVARRHPGAGRGMRPHCRPFSGALPHLPKRWI